MTGSGGPDERLRQDADDATVRLAGHGAAAVILPHLGGRVQSLRDVRSSRELLYQRPGEPSTEFIAASTGGWDELFPNDAPFAGHPDHGRFWSADFRIVDRTLSSVRLVTTLTDPAVTITRNTRCSPRRAGASRSPRRWKSTPTPGRSCGAVTPCSRSNRAGS